MKARRVLISFALLFGFMLSDITSAVSSVKPEDFNIGNIQQRAPMVQFLRIIIKKIRNSLFFTP